MPAIIPTRIQCWVAESEHTDPMRMPTVWYTDGGRRLTDVMSLPRWLIHRMVRRLPLTGVTRLYILPTTIEQWPEHIAGRRWTPEDVMYCSQTGACELTLTHRVNCETARLSGLDVTSLLYAQLTLTIREPMSILCYDQRRPRTRCVTSGEFQAALQVWREDRANRDSELERAIDAQLDADSGGEW